MSKLYITYDAVDLKTIVVSQSTRAFGVTHKCQEVLKDIWMRNTKSVEKSAKVEEEAKKERAGHVDEAAKLNSPLAKIEFLKKKLYEW